MHLFETEKPFDVKPDGSWKEAYAGEWLPVTFCITRDPAQAKDLRLHQMRSVDPNVLLDIDMFQHGLVIRPGETYRFLVPIQVKEPQEVELSKIQFGYEMLDDPGRAVYWQAAGTSKFEAKPSLKHLLEVQMESLCQYEEGTKVMMTVRHKGAKLLVDLAIDFPANAIAAGKPSVRRPRFDSGEVELVEMVVGQTEFEVVITAIVDCKKSEWREILKIAKPKAASAEMFRFLEPRRLARDVVSIVHAHTKRAVPQDHSTFLLEAHSKYQVTIKPAHEADDVEVGEIPTLAHILKRDRKKGQWEFTLEVLASGIVRKSERLYYEVSTKDGTMSGEVPICVHRTFWQYFSSALQWGILSLIGGGFGIWSWWKAYGLNWERFEMFDLLRVFAIPICLFGYWFLDWLQYQFAK